MTVSHAPVQLDLFCGPADSAPTPESDAWQTLLPNSLSATALEALRDCPYRFHVRSVLRLHERDDLHGEPARRELGTWIHAVLQRFHEEEAKQTQCLGADARPSSGSPPSRPERAARLARLSDEAEAEELAAHGLPDSAWLAERLWWQAQQNDYLDWLDAHESAGWRYGAGEVALRAEPPVLRRLGLALEGRIDRLDVAGPGPWRAGDGRAVFVLDYKTGGLARLKSKASQRDEETQLAFYAALIDAAALELETGSAGRPAALEAAYLALEGERVEPIERADPRAAGEHLVHNVADHWERVLAGAVLPALGHESVCAWCEARGICRRDHRHAQDDPHQDDRPGDGAEHGGP